MNPIGGRGYWGWGPGGGRGWRHWFYATAMPGSARAGFGYPAWGGVVHPYAPYAAPVPPAVAPEQELQGLKQQAEFFESALEEIKKRIEQVEAEGKE
jgi:hypothetical protein